MQYETLKLRRQKETDDRPDVIYALLKDYIINGTNIPGERLNIVELADVLKVSLTPVREALIRLTSERLVTSVPNKGFFLKSPLLEELLQLHELATVVLGTCAGKQPQASIRGQMQAWKQQFETMSGQTARLGTDTDLTGTMEALWLAIAALGGNLEFREIIQNFNDRTHFITILEVDDPEIREALSSHLTRLLDAMIEGGSTRDAVHEIFALKTSALPRLVMESLARSFGIAHASGRPFQAASLRPKVA
ncbi:GntR family transcriptional regulator [Rhizobium terrae]|uniref:GntR family transcriptional regulator n=1 Tax=Rhizobium terrae TaxID=2171756 RepID=UPI0013C321F7|nr:GntR family transcriptional regulator [Rhizobium terrae]